MFVVSIDMPRFRCLSSIDTVLLVRSLILPPLSFRPIRSRQDEGGAPLCDVACKSSYHTG